MDKRQIPGVEHAVVVVEREMLNHGRYDDPLMPGLQISVRKLREMLAEDDEQWPR